MRKVTAHAPFGRRMMEALRRESVPCVSVDGEVVGKQQAEKARWAVAPEVAAEPFAWPVVKRLAMECQGVQFQAPVDQVRYVAGRWQLRPGPSRDWWFLAECQLDALHEQVSMEFFILRDPQVTPVAHEPEPEPEPEPEQPQPVGRKDDAGKFRRSLVPGLAMREVVAVLEHGAREYGADNWRKVEGWRKRYYDAAGRHEDAYWVGGEQRDRESGKHHLAHAICSLMFMLEKELEAERG